MKRYFFTLLFVPCALFVALLSYALGAVDKPTGFSGYLLDDRGFEKKNPDSIWREDFESDGVSWRYLYQDGDVKLRTHRRVQNYAYEGSRSEFISYEVKDPGVVILAHYVDYPSIYNDVEPSLWIRSDRPGVALAALVVFPKTLRPDNGEPLVAMIPGSAYKNPGEWQRLDFPAGLAKTLESTAQSLRGEYKLPVNTECAYVRQLLLVSEARIGRYSLWIDDLQIANPLPPSIESLKLWEKNAAFTPLNLQGCRLKLSNTPVFGSQDFSENDLYEREPFAIDVEKVNEKKKRKLSFASDAGAQKAATSPSKTDRASEFADTEPTFFAASRFLNRNGAFSVRPTEELFALTPSRETRLPDRVEQTNFADAMNKNQVVSVAFDESARSLGELPVPSVQQSLVVGSGTLERPEDAIVDSFRRPSERLIADVEFHDGQLETRSDQKVYSIRAVEYQGESFQFLKGLGFNAIWLHEAPTARQLSDAQEVGVWLIAAPPVGSQLVSNEDVARIDALKKNSADQNAAALASPKQNMTQEAANSFFAGKEVPSSYDPVLVWYIGGELRENDAENVRNDLMLVRRLDPLRRPIVGSVKTGIDRFSQEGALDALLLNREPLLSSLDLNDYANWLVRIQNLATNTRAVFWNIVQTQPTITATLQRQFCGMADETPGVVSYEQIRQLVRLSMFAKCRGLFFASNSPLDAKDHKTQYRAAALESINLELLLVEPWFALGDPDPELLKTSYPNIKGIVSQTKRSLLFVPVSTEKDNQYVMGQDAVNNLTATVPTREGYSPDLLTPGALRKIVSRRRAGGCYFTLDEGSMNSLLFFTQSDSMSQKLSERAPVFGERLATLAVGLARKRLDLYEQTVYALRYVEEHGYFPKSAPHAPALGEVVQRVGDQIDSADIFLKRGDFSQAYLVAERATREIRNIERRFWSEATRNELTKPVTPLSASFYDMPAYLELYDKLLSGKLRANDENLIRGGDMERAQSLADNGWTLQSRQTNVLRGRASSYSYVANQDPSGGGRKESSSVLKLVVEPIDDVASQKIPQQIEGNIVEVETEFPSKVGQLICVQGWIRIPKKLTNSVDGFEIYDNQGGRALALRFQEATEWKRFAFYRHSTSDGLMRVRFAMSGVGEVWLDDVAAYVVEALDPADADRTSIPNVLE